MSTPKRRLGRGLGGLISAGGAAPSAGSPASPPSQDSRHEDFSPGAPASPSANNTPPVDGFREIRVDSIVPNPHQPRREFSPESLEELADSIRSEGLLQPIVVRPDDDGHYLLVAGERRWRACQSLALKTIPARIVQVSEASAAVISMIENLQRENLNPIEESLGYASLMRDFDLTQEAVAERVGKPRSSIANALRLLQLERELQGYLSKGLLSVGHAKVLLGVENSDQRLLLARRVLEKSLSVRETERLVSSLRNLSAASPQAARPHSPTADTAAVADLEKRLTSRLATKVQLRHTPKKGRLIIEYYGNEDLQRLLEVLGLDRES